MPHRNRRTHDVGLVGPCTLVFTYSVKAAIAVDTGASPYRSDEHVFQTDSDAFESVPMVAHPTESERCLERALATMSQTRI